MKKIIALLIAICFVSVSTQAQCAKSQAQCAKKCAASEKKADLSTDDVKVMSVQAVSQNGGIAKEELEVKSKCTKGSKAECCKKNADKSACCAKNKAEASQHVIEKLNTEHKCSGHKVELAPATPTEKK